MFSKHRTTSELVELAQWSDLIVFDYLTANLDRVVNNLYNLQWNPAMMDAPAHNLAREPNSGLLVFFDNESGLLHGYRLLGKYEAYHGALLGALCVFRRSTADAIKRLHSDKNVGHLLQARFDASEPEFRDFLPSLPDKSIKILNERIDRVYEQIRRCERQYSARN
jgi:four-jointed box protein 1